MSKIIKALVIILAFITLFVFVYMYAKYFGTNGYYVKEYLIESETMSKDYDGLKIANLSKVYPLNFLFTLVFHQSLFNGLFLVFVIVAI